MKSQGAWPGHLERGGFGKLPLLPDFVTAGASDADARVLDKWVQEGLYQAQRDFPERWQAYFDANLLYRFVFRPQDGQQTFVGLLRAAMDVHKRRFPIVHFARFDTAFLDRAPVLVPTLSESIFPELEEGILDVASLDNLTEVQEGLRCPMPFFPPEPSINQRYGTFLEEVVCADMMGPGGEPGEEILMGLIRSLSSLSARPDTITHCIEVPLNQPPFARGLEVRFWVDLCLILLHWFPHRLSWFWRSGDPKPRTTSLILSFRPPPSYLWGGMLRRDGVARGLKRIWHPGEWGDARSPRRIDVTLHADHSLRSLLDCLCPGYPLACPWNRSLAG